MKEPSMLQEEKREQAGHIWRDLVRQSRWVPAGVAGLFLMMMLMVPVIPLADADEARLVLYFFPLASVAMIIGAVERARRRAGIEKPGWTPRIRPERKKYVLNRPYLSLGYRVDRGRELVVPNVVGIDPHHILVTGATGWGKTGLFLALFNQGVRGSGPVIFFNGKHKDTLTNRVAYQVWQARRWQDFRPLNIEEPLLSLHIDCLYGQSVYDQVRLIEGLFDYVPEDRPHAFYRQTSLNFLPDLFVALRSTGWWYSLKDLYAFYLLPDETVSYLTHAHGSCKGVQDFAKTWRDRTADRAIRDDVRRAFPGMVNRLKWFVEPPLDRIFCPAETDFTMSEVLRNNLVLFITMEADGKERSRMVGRLLMQSIWIAIESLTAHQHNFKVDPPGLGIFDEYTNYMVSDTGTIVRKTRESWMRLVFGAQALTDFVSVRNGGGKDILEAVVQNMRIKITGATEGESAEIAERFFPRMKKTRVRWRTSMGTGYGGGSNGGSWASRRDAITSDRTVEAVDERPIESGEFGTLETGEAVAKVLTEGPIPLLVNRVLDTPREFVLRKDMLWTYRQAHKRTGRPLGLYEKVVKARGMPAPASLEL